MPPECDPSQTLQQSIYGPGGPEQTYGQAVVNRINFARGRIYPAFQVNASAGADVYKSDRMNVRFQSDGQNLNNVLNVIDFGGLFFGQCHRTVAKFAMRSPPTFRVKHSACITRGNVRWPSVETPSYSLWRKDERWDQGQSAVGY